MAAHNQNCGQIPTHPFPFFTQWYVARAPTCGLEHLVRSLGFVDRFPSVMIELLRSWTGSDTIGTAGGGRGQTRTLC